MYLFVLCEKSAILSVEDDVGYTHKTKSSFIDSVVFMNDIMKDSTWNTYWNNGYVYSFDFWVYYDYSIYTLAAYETILRIFDNATSTIAYDNPGYFTWLDTSYSNNTFFEFGSNCPSIDFYYFTQYVNECVYFSEPSIERIDLTIINCEENRYSNPGEVPTLSSCSKCSCVCTHEICGGCGKSIKNNSQIGTRSTPALPTVCANHVYCEVTTCPWWTTDHDTISRLGLTDSRASAIFDAWLWRFRSGESN